MPRDHEHNPDPNVNAARIVNEATGVGPQKQPSSVARIEAQARQVARELQSTSVAPSDVEAAWAAWSIHIQIVDERGMTLLRAAFEAGWEAAIAAGRA
jgi:hypothetical protein